MAEVGGWSEWAVRKQIILAGAGDIFPLAIAF
jgi:hypothetical protein